MINEIVYIFAAIAFSTAAFAQGAPKVGSKPLVQVKPRAVTGCKMVGTGRGTKLWAGECAASSELRGAAPADEAAVPAPTSETNSPAAKQ